MIETMNLAGPSFRRVKISVTTGTSDCTWILKNSLEGSSWKNFTQTEPEPFP